MTEREIRQQVKDEMRVREMKLRARIDDLLDQLEAKAVECDERVVKLQADLAKVRAKSDQRYRKIYLLNDRVNLWKMRCGDYRHDAQLYRDNKRRRKYTRLVEKRATSGNCADCGDPCRGERCLPCFKATGQFGRRVA